MSFPSQTPRDDLFVTTALKPDAALIERASAFAHELNAPLAARRNDGLTSLFAAHPAATRTLIVQTDRLFLTHRNGAELFYHPNMAYLRLGNLLRGERDLLIEAAGILPGDSVLDATIGYASEAILCAYAAGPLGEVHGIEAVPELGLVVREGLRTVTTRHQNLNALMRRIQIVHLGNHLDFLRACPTNRYDVVCFDPFFEEVLKDSENLDSLRTFGEHTALVAEAIAEARRVARRRVVVKAVRWADTLASLGIERRVDSRGGKVVYGVIDCVDKQRTVL